MKPTDFMPRPSMLQVYLHGKDLVGVEVGVDAGAHAEAILTYCDIKFLYLVDTWENNETFGYCRGRLETKGWKHQFQMIRKSSLDAIAEIQKTVQYIDFLYLDQLHDYQSVHQDLEQWWPLLRPGAIIVQRNYAASNEGITKAVSEFIIKNDLKHIVDTYHNEIIIWK